MLLVDGITNLKEASKYIEDNYNDIIASYDERFRCVDLERCVQGYGPQYIGCLFDMKDFNRFVEDNKK